jgi:hypothetical protein
MKHFSLKALAFSTFLTTAALGGALAQDANAVAERLKAVLAGQGMELAWTGVSGGGDTVVLDGVTIKATSGGAGEVANLGQVTLSGVVEENGGYTIGTVALQDYSNTEDGATVNIAGISLTNLVLPAEGANDPMSMLMMYQNADVASITVDEGGKRVFSMDNIHFEVTPPADGQAMAFSGAAEKFSADLTSADDPEAKKAIEALGYQQINGFFQIEGTWQPTDGRIALTQYDISVENAGTIGFTLDLGGYTLDFIKAMQDASKNGDSGQQGMQMLGLMQQLAFHSLAIRFDDDSLTKKVLDYVGAQQGMTGADIANQMKAMVPILLAQAQLNELVQPASEAITKFLDDPKSLEIAAEPGSPVPFALIIAGAMSGAPQELAKTLAVKITANED